MTINVEKTVVRVRHSELERASKSSCYKSKCPVCKKGILLIYRDKNTLQLSEYDRCMSCGQRFVYTDIDKVRSMEGN